MPRGNILSFSVEHVTVPPALSLSPQKTSPSKSPINAWANRGKVKIVKGAVGASATASARPDSAGAGGR